MSITVENKVVLGGVPLKTIQLETPAYNEYSNKYTTAFAIEIIIVENLPIKEDDIEYSFFWYGTQYALKKSTNNKLYFCSYIESGTTSEDNIQKEISLKGIPLATKNSPISNQIGSLIFKNSGYTIDDIEEERYPNEGYVCIGGMPISLGRIGNYWYLIVCSLPISSEL